MTLQELGRARWQARLLLQPCSHAVLAADAGRGCCGLKCLTSCLLVHLSQVSDSLGTGSGGINCTPCSLLARLTADLPCHGHPVTLHCHVPHGSKLYSGMSGGQQTFFKSSY